MVIRGIAYQDGRILIGDHLLYVNLQDVRGASLDTVMRLLVESGKQVTLSLASTDKKFVRYSSSSVEAHPDASTVAIECSNSQGPGFSISGEDKSGSSIFISILHAGSHAERSGRLHCGDQILAINGQDISQFSLPQVDSLLQAARNVLTIDIRSTTDALACNFADVEQQEKMYIPKRFTPVDLRLIELPHAKQHISVKPNSGSVFSYTEIIHQVLGFRIVGPHATRTDPQRSGIFVATVQRDSFAEQQGLRVGDQLIEISGNASSDWASLLAATADEAVAALAKFCIDGEAVSLVVAENMLGYVVFSADSNKNELWIEITRSNRQPSSLELSLEDSNRKSPSHSQLNTNNSELDTYLRNRILVQSVKLNSRVASVGIKPGMELFSINELPVSTIGDAMKVEDWLAHEENDVVLHFIVPDKNDQLKRHTQTMKEDQQLMEHPTTAKHNKQKAHESSFSTTDTESSAIMSQKTANRQQQRSHGGKSNRQGKYPSIPFHIRALYNYTATEPDTIPFQRRDILKVHDVSDPDWWVATHLTSGKCGRIPSRSRREKDFKMTREWNKLCARADKVLTKEERRLTLTQKVTGRFFCHYLLINENRIKLIGKFHVEFDTEPQHVN